MIRSTTKITLDVSRPNVAANVYAVSDDFLSRWVEATLTDGSVPLEIPNPGSSVLIRYRKPDGTAGLYDTLEDESTAWSISGNVVSFGLAAQMLTVPGIVQVEVHIYTFDSERLTTFRFNLHVSADVIGDSEIISADYFNVMTATVAEMITIRDQTFAAYGAPRVAATAAAMTDHSFIYVYTGNESGYTAGNWYYWTGSAWASGGVYNSSTIIDATLTISGDAADAKKTGQLGAPEYSSSLGYQAGEVVLYNGTLYRCVSAITTPEAFTAAHWAALNLGNGSTAGGDALYETTELSASGAADAYYGTPASVTIPLKRGWNVNTGNGSLITGSSTTETAVSEPVRGDRFESVTVKAGYKVAIFGNDLGPGHAVRGVTSAYQGSASADTVVRLDTLIPAAHCSWLWFTVKKYADGDIRSDTAASTALTAAAYPIRDKTADRLDTLEGVDVVQAPVVLNGKNVVVFGDSIPAGVYSTGASTTEISWTKSWAYLLCTAGGAAAIDNQTVSGSRFLTLSDSETSILNKIRFYSGTADVVIVAGGVNDWISLSPLGKYSDGAGNYGTSFYAAVRSACDTIRVGFPNAQVIFTTPLTVCDNAGNLHTSGAGENIPLSRYRKAIFELASYNGFTVIDGSDLGFPRRQGGYQNEVTKDGLHPTIRGHEMLAAVIADRLGLHSISIDNTLTKAGQAAEAKATGDAIDELKSAFDDLARPELTWIDGKYINASGGLSSNDSYHWTGLIDVGNTGNRFYYRQLAFASLGINVYDAGSNVIATILPSQSSTPVYVDGVIDLSQYPNARYLAFGASKISDFDLRLVDEFKKTLTVPDGALTTQMLQDNAVTLPKIAFAQHDPETNFLDLTNLITGKIINQAGAVATASGWCCTDFIELTPGMTYYRSEYVYRKYWGFYNAAKEVVGCYNTDGELTYSFTFPVGAKYARFSFQNTEEYLSNVYVAINSGKPFDFGYELTVEQTYPTEFDGGDVSTFNKLLCIGDSLTYGYFNRNSGATADYAAMAAKYSYPTQFKKITGVDTTNKGDSGKTTAQWYELHGSEDLSGHDLCIIELGTNDGTWTSDSETAMSSIIAKVKADNKGIKIFVSTIPPGQSYVTAAYKAINAGIRAYVNGLSDADVYFVDLEAYGHTIQSKGYNAGHLSAYGYWRLAKDYANYISWIMNGNRDAFRLVQFTGTDDTYTP